MFSSSNEDRLTKDLEDQDSIEMEDIGWVDLVLVTTVVDLLRW